MSSDVLSTAEKAKRLKQGVDSGMTEEDVRQKIMPELGLKPSGDLLKKLLFLGTLCDMPGADIVSLAAVPYLRRLGTKGAEAALHLFDELKPGTNFQREILSLTEEIVLRDHITAEDVLEEAASDIPDATHPRARRVEAIRNTLFRRRYPRLSACEEKFSSVAAKINVGPNVTWSHEPAFEDGRVTVTFSFESVEEYENVLKELTNVSQREIIDELVRVCNCEVKISGKTADM
jgi:hypothetical protein